MIPILFESDETLFATNGLGRLADAISCKVTEQVNGAFELEMTYPIGGSHFDDIEHSRIIFAEPRPNSSPQPFQIYRITKPMKGVVSIYAEHISYRLSQCIVLPFAAGTLNASLAALKSSTVIPHPFTFSSDFNVVDPVDEPFSVVDPASTRAVMGGQDNSIVNHYGGEWVWDKFQCILKQNRGQNRGVTIRYGKNLLDMTQEKNIQSVYTGIVPYWKGQNIAGEEDYVFLDDDGSTKHRYMIKDGISENYPYQRLMLVDLSREFDGIPDDEELRAAGAEYLANAQNVGVPAVSLTISFVSLAQTEEYKDIALLEEVDLCDTVTVEFEKLGVSTTAKVVKAVYNVLLERYDSLELGEAQNTLAQSVQKDVSAVTKKVNGEISALTVQIENDIERSSEYIKGGLGGYVMVRENANGQPEEILVTDNADLEHAGNVLRINKNGIGFSTSGYAGTYTDAWTIDGKFTTDFISTWNLNANVITTGMMKSINGNVYFDLDNNMIVCSQLVSGRASRTGGITNQLTIKTNVNATDGGSIDFGTNIYGQSITNYDPFLKFIQKTGELVIADVSDGNVSGYETFIITLGDYETQYSNGLPRIILRRNASNVPEVEIRNSDGTGFEIDGNLIDAQGSNIRATLIEAATVEATYFSSPGVINFRNSSNEVIAKIRSNGDMYIKGNLYVSGSVYPNSPWS